MSGGYAQPFEDSDPAARRRRAVSLTLTVLAHILLLLLLLRYAPHAEPAAKGPTALIVNLVPETSKARTPHPSTPHVQRARQAHPAAAAQAPAPKPPPPPPPVPTPNVKLDIVQLSHEDFVGGDISKLPSHKQEMAAAAEGSGQGEGAAAPGGGEGPGGVTLYAADWYRRPTHAELATYLPAGAPEGSGLIACKTEPQFRVDDCKILGETPAGSGLGRAVLNAAWQFRVLPPRINGKPQIGAWVRIEVTYTHGIADVGD